MASTLLTRRAMTCSMYGPICWIPTRRILSSSRISKAFISAEAEVVCAQGWVCIPTFYFIFLTNKIIIRSIYFRRFLCHFYQKIGQDCQSV